MQSLPVPQTASKQTLPDQDVISPREMVQTLKKYKWAIAGVTVAASMIATLAAFSMTPVYQATAMLELEREQAKVLSVEELYGLEGDTDIYLNTQYEVLKSRSVMEKVIKRLNLLEDPEYNSILRPKPWHAQLLDWRRWLGITPSVKSIKKEEPVKKDKSIRILNNTISTLLGTVQISPIKKTQIVKVNVTSKNPERAASIANAVANSYIDSYLEAKVSQTASATFWMQARLQELAEKLTKAEGKLQAYREQENLVEMKGVLTLSNNELQTLTRSLLKERQTLTVSRNIYNQIQEGDSKDKMDLSSLPAVLADPLMKELKHIEARIVRTVQELSLRYGSKHPKMMAVQSELISIRSNIALQVEQILSGIENEHKVAKATEASLSKAVAESRRRVQEINRKQFRLQALERAVQTNKDLYAAFFKRIQETNATSDLQTSNARIVDEAYPRYGAIKPKRSFIITLSAILSLMVSCGLAFLLEMMNSTIRKAKDIEDKLNLPVLGLLPIVRDKNEEEMQRLFMDDDEHSFGEAIRTIRTSIALTTLEKGHKVFAVTSSVPEEGKSTISCNLALAMGRLGKTIIIGCDMRRPTLEKRLGMKNGLSGLSNLLSGTCKGNECIFTVGEIDVMPSGVIPPNPQELLASKRFSLMIRYLRKYYDNIILDCPPVQSIADTLMVSKESDGMIYVVESGRIHIQEITAAIDRLLQSHAHITGVVLNKTESSKEEIESSYKYYSHEDEQSSESS